MCCYLITIHEEAFLAAFPVSNGGEPGNKYLEITCRYAHPLGGHFQGRGVRGTVGSRKPHLFINHFQTK